MNITQFCLYIAGTEKQITGGKCDPVTVLHNPIYNFASQLLNQLISQTNYLD